MCIYVYYKEKRIYVYIYIYMNHDIQIHLRTRLMASTVEKSLGMHHETVQVRSLPFSVSYIMLSKNAYILGFKLPASSAISPAACIIRYFYDIDQQNIVRFIWSGS